MPRTRFGSRSRLSLKRRPVVSPKLLAKRVLNLKGLDQVLPDEISQDGSSPFLKNARYYAEKETNKRVAISTKKGARFYSKPIGEAEDDTEVSTTAASTQDISTTTWVAQDFTTTTAGRLTKVELNLNTETGTGPIIVEIYTDVSSAPGVKLATSSILGSELGSSAAYLTARFIEAPKVATTTKYWIVAYIQDNGTGTYDWTSTTNTTTGLTATDSGVTWGAASVSFNFKTHIATDFSLAGYFRRKTETGTAETLLAGNGSVHAVNDITGATTSLTSGLSANADYYSFANILGQTYIANGVDVIQQYDGTTATTNTIIPRARLLTQHKNRLFAVVSDTEFKWSGSDDDLNDIDTWLSTSFAHVPSPFTGDPITAMIPFQDNLVFFTRSSKYILYGDDPANFSLSQAVGKMGAVHQRAVTADENYLYFISDDGVYRFDGSQDERISDKIQPLIEEIADITKASLTHYDRKLRLYHRPPGQGFHNEMALYDIVYQDWFNDTGTYSKDALVFNQEVSQQLVEVSSVVGAVYYGESQYSDMGRPIEFEYRTKYFDFKRPTQEKIPKRFNPLLRSQSTPFNLVIKIDKDFADSPTDSNTTNLAMQATGDTWGNGDLWDSTFQYGSSHFKHRRVSGNGKATFVQARISRTGVNNPVEIIGYEWQYTITRSR